ncbi:hypothetical protein [Sphingomonas sp. Ant20]|uniref:hypothetical protein n=1 Tax=Sphingomonas sp. Ant20 TaxID=104605 RepID=UPI000A51699A|nr:hypothetical protein [Sphingomonas sp. Ant20]
MTRIFVSLAVLATATAFASPAAAEPDPIAAATGEAAGGDAELVVTASRSGDAVPADQLGASVTVLDAATLDQRQTRIVSDVLRDVPALAVSRTGAVGGDDAGPDPRIGGQSRAGVDRRDRSIRSLSGRI